MLAAQISIHTKKDTVSSGACYCAIHIFIASAFFRHKDEHTETTGSEVSICSDGEATQD